MSFMYSWQLIWLGKVVIKFDRTVYLRRRESTPLLIIRLHCVTLFHFCPSLPPKASLAVVKLLLDDGFIGPNFLSASASGTDSGRLPALEVQAELVRHIEEMARRH
jgi:hypothetical protein